MSQPTRAIDEKAARPVPVPAPPQAQNQPAEEINSNTLMILTTGSGLTYQPMAADLATVLNDGDSLRVLPVQGCSAYQNVRDLCYLRGIDLAFTRTNILNRWRQRGEIPDLDQRIVYILKVANEEENIIVRSDITSIEQLRGKKVNFNLVGSGTQMSARDIFGALEIEVEETNLNFADALQRLREGGITAVMATAGKPSSHLRRLKWSEGYRMVSIPLKDSLIGDYVPSTLEHEDYPDLIPDGQTVDTLASGIVIIAPNWPKTSDHYRRIDRFVNALFSQLKEFQIPPRHEKWKETILAAKVPGWRRFEGAEAWLKNDGGEQLNARRDQIQAASEADRNQRLENFMRWMRRSTAH
jgi:uncharacterized protein